MSSPIRKLLRPGAVLEVENLCKRFDQVVAVEAVSFCLRPGEIVGLLGPNGAGKTTIIQMLLGLIIPTSGAVRFFGLDMETDREAILERVNFSSTYVSIPYSLTAYECLIVFARLYGVKNAAARIRYLLERFEMTPLAHRLVRTLSTGQVTRLCLAKALLNQPEVLLLDEPTASLDPDIADKTRTILVEIQKREGTAILYTSHNMREMEQMCDRLLFLQRGRIVAEGAPQELLGSYGETDLEKLFVRIARQQKP